MNLKILLTPFTLLIWYFIVYNVFYYSMIGVLLTFSFKWYFLIISSSILCFIYMMYVSFTTSVLGGLIQRLYVDNFWIKLFHIAIGLLAYIMCIKTIYFDSPDNYIKIFWNESVFKTFIIAVPIFTIHVTNFLINFLFVIDDEK